jgi:hypothetical protein
VDQLPTTAFLEPYSPHIREIAERLRSIVLGEEPDAIERVRAGWRLIGYDLPVGRRTVYFAFVAPEPLHVHLGFEHGIFMDDPDRRMRGAHLKLRKVRYLTLRSMDEIDEVAFRELVREAARIARLSRDERLAIAADREARVETR